MRILFTILLFLISLFTRAQEQYWWALNGAMTPPFVPPAGSLQAWYRSDTGVTVSAGNASQWNDISGNNYHLLSATPTILNPLYTTNCITANGVSYPCIAVDPASTAGLQAGTNFPAFSNLTVYMVTQLMGNTGNFGRLIDCDFQNGWWIGRSGTTNNLVGGARAVGTPFGSVAATTPDTWQLVKLTWNGSVDVLKVGNTTGPNFNTTGTTTPNKLTLYANFTLNTPGKFKTTEIFIYTRLLTTDEQTYIETYLKTKYGLP